MSTNSCQKSFRYFFVLFLVFLFSAFFQSVNAQGGYDRIEKGRMKDILNNIKKDIRKNYYDANFHGVNIDERFKKAEERLDQVTSVGQAFAVIAQVLVDFDDSHLYFVPPATTANIEYGFKMKMVGDKDFITAVNPESDAAAKGLKIGDQLVSIEGFRPNRKDLWKMIYFYYILSPRTKLQLNVLHPGSSQPQVIEAEAKITQNKRVIDINNTIDYSDLIRASEKSSKRRISYFEKVGNTVIWKMMTFAFDPAKIDEMMQQQVKKGSNLVLDLRGNGGGYIKTLEQLAGYFFDKDTKIAERKGREGKSKENEPMMAKSKGDNIFAGKLVILIDSESASASEMFARFIQLEKRGIVLGDVSAGAVMQAIRYPGEVGSDRKVFYATSITDADVIMSDGKSIEHTGVTPDELIIPSAADLANRRDPVLAKALAMLGNSVTSEQAGKIYPDDEWEK